MIVEMSTSKFEEHSYNSTWHPHIGKEGRLNINNLICQLSKLEKNGKLSWKKIKRGKK